MAQFRFHNAGMEKLFNTYIKKGCWKFSFIDHWDKHAKLFPEKEALVDSEKRLTWSQVKRLSDRLALALLELGLNRDDIIGVQLPWSVDFCLLRAAHEKAGIIQMELAPTLKQRDVAHHLTTTEAKAMVIAWRYRNFDYYAMIEEIRYKLPHLKHIIIVGEVPSERVISFDEMLQNPLEKKYPESYLIKSRHTPFELDGLRHTTGTTGMPKLIQSNSACLEWAGSAHLAETGEKISSDTICGIICPAITGPNVFTFYSSSIVGARIVLLEQFRPERALEFIEKERINVIGVVPAQLTMMMQHPDFNKYDLGSLFFIVCAGASLNFSVALKAEKKFKCPVVQHYGSVETGVVTVLQHYSEPREKRLLTVGKPSVQCDVKIVDEKGQVLNSGESGIIMARSPTMAFGYYKDSEGSSKTWDQDGWCKMGDLGKFDKNGNLVLVGREKDIIIRGGQNIYPLEVENLISTHPKVSQVAIIPMPDPVMGEKACAVVVLKEGEELSFNEIVAFLKEKKITSYKIPERLEVIDKMPLAGEQKIDKKALEKHFFENKFENKS